MCQNILVVKTVRRAHKPKTWSRDFSNVRKGRYSAVSDREKMRRERELRRSSFRTHGGPFRQVGLALTVAYETWFRISMFCANTVWYRRRMHENFQRENVQFGIRVGLRKNCWNMFTGNHMTTSGQKCSMIKLLHRNDSMVSTPARFLSLNFQNTHKRKHRGASEGESMIVL